MNIYTLYFEVKYLKELSMFLIIVGNSKCEADPFWGGQPFSDEHMQIIFSAWHHAIPFD